MKIAIVRERADGETRVAATPDTTVLVRGESGPLPRAP